MTYDREIHHRRSTRLSGYDYTAAGAYFVTLCTEDRACLFGEIVEGEMRLNEMGRVTHEEWLRSATIRREIELDEFVVMPNHIHGIVVFNTPDGGRGCQSGVGAHGRAPLRPAGQQRASGQSASEPSVSEQPGSVHRAHGRAPLRVPRSLGSLIAGFKSVVTTRVNVLRITPGVPVWQRNYHDHIIRDDGDLNRIRDYIRLNPSRWAEDEENPNSVIAANRRAWPFDV